jgi:hypothetical protein
MPFLRLSRLVLRIAISIALLIAILWAAAALWIDGSLLTVRDVRNFQYRDEDDFTERRETRAYDLDDPDILRSPLSKTDIAAAYAYEAASNYVEEYNSHFGTGLVVESIPMLEKIIKDTKINSAHKTFHSMRRILKAANESFQPTT